MTGCQRLLVVSIGLLLLLGAITHRGVVAIAQAEAPPSRYTYPATGTAYDIRTQLTWQRAVDAGNYTQSAAITYCTRLSLAGTGWRLPTKAELESIVDYTRATLAFDPVAFPNTPAEMFWASTPYSPTDGYAWAISFSRGFSYGHPTSSAYRVRCVR